MWPINGAAEANELPHHASAKEKQQPVSLAAARRPSMYDDVQASRAHVTVSQSFHHRNLNPSKAHVSANDLMDGLQAQVVEDDVVRDSKLQFSSVVFIKEAFYNLAWPASLPLAFVLEGLNGVRARSFWPSRGDWGTLLSYSVLLYQQAGTWLPGIAYGMGLCPSFSLTEVATTTLVTVLHRFCVATKYAYLNDAERRSINNENGSASHREMEGVMNEIQLSGWSCQNRSTILLHAKKAEARLFGDLDAVAVRFQKTPPIPARPLVRMSRVERGVSASEGRDASPSVLTVALAVLDCCCGRPVDAPDKHGIISSKFAAIVCMLITLTIVAVPGVLRAARGQPPGGTNATEGVIYSMILFNQIQFSFVTFLFLHIAYADYSRRAAQLRLLNQMLSHGAGGGLGGFRISLDAPLNGCAFIMVLRLLHHTARVFVLRMSAFALWYFGIFAARCVVIVFSFLLPLLYGDEIEAASVTTTAIEVGSTLVFFTLITSAIG
jgi:hypothetical protein